MKPHFRRAIGIAFITAVALHAADKAGEIYAGQNERGYLETFNRLRYDASPLIKKCSMEARLTNLVQAWWTGTRTAFDFYQQGQMRQAAMSAAALPYIGLAFAEGADRGFVRYCAAPMGPPPPKPDLPPIPDTRDRFELDSVPREPRRGFNI